MNCVDIEGFAAEYIDGTLARDVRAAVEQHLSVCTACAEFFADAAEGASLLARLPEVEPPEKLVTLIAFHAPVGRTRDPLASPPSFVSRMISKWLQPILQPRFAMSMAMTIVSFAMLQRCTGIQVQHIQAADLTPTHIVQGIEEKTVRVRDRAVKYYENLRLVYEVETRLNQMESERDSSANEQENQKSRTSKVSGAAGDGSQPPQHAEEKRK